MRKLLFLTAAVCLFAVAAFAQDKKPNFSGTWSIDVSKSKLGDRNSIESQTLTVTQTDKDIKVATATKRIAPPAGAPTGGPPGGRMGGGGMGGGDSTNTYTLDGKETTVEVESPMGKVPVKLTGKLDGGKLSLASSRTINSQMGEMTIINKETWSLSADGNTLTVDAESTSPRGTNTTQKVYTKKP